MIRITSLKEHLKVIAERNLYLKFVSIHEQNKLVCIIDEFLKALNLEVNQENVSLLVKFSIKETDVTTSQGKNQHRFLYRKQTAVNGYNKLSNSWINTKGLIFHHTEVYVFAMQEQEINTRAWQTKREQGNSTEFGKSCHFCYYKTEDIFYLLYLCERLSASMYLPMRHNEIGRDLYNAIIKHYFT